MTEAQREAEGGGAPELVRLRLAGRREVAGVVVGVLAAVMDESSGRAVATVHLAEQGRAGRRVEVVDGDRLRLGGETWQVVAVVPWTGERPAGVVLGRVA
ncbi:hypothetical protein ACT3TZ_13080 [Brachybacterium sp. AOP25-B2-12]|uniref:hypothetical protein n=1 Tax=Brachybacterium sp. AOP25-B2-12 TaxID=3457710 RepID=UPI004033C544